MSLLRAEALPSKFHLWHDGTNAVSVAGAFLLVANVVGIAGRPVVELAFDSYRSVLADKPDKPALNANLIRAEDAGLVRGICRFQCD